MLQAELAALPEDTHSAREAGRQLQFIIDALLTLSRIESGNAKARPQMIDVIDVVDTAWRGLDKAAQAQSMQVKRRVDPLLELSTDPVHLGMALRNLFDNAVSHGDARGTITLAAEEENDGICFTVRNTCAGALPELVDLMFDPRWRNGSSTIGGGHLHGAWLHHESPAELLGGSVKASLKDDQLSIQLYVQHAVELAVALSQRRIYGQGVSHGISAVSAVITNSHHIGLSALRSPPAVANLKMDV